MTATLHRIEFPELVFGFVSPIGTETKHAIGNFEEYLRIENYNIFTVKITDLFQELKEIILPSTPLIDSPSLDRYQSYIAYGNKIREEFNDDSALAILAISEIVKRRGSNKKEKNAYLIDQLKRKEEVDLLRSIYGRLFFQVSIYSRRGARIEYLSNLFATSSSKIVDGNIRADAEKIVQQDENENEQMHGQRVSSIFHDADFILNTDIPGDPIRRQVKRFIRLIFGSNSISPTKQEYGMFAAKAAALRTLDLSRQVGVAIFSSQGEIICMGSNEVPKAGGGTYWSDDSFDDRDFCRKIDTNQLRKREILEEIFRLIGIDHGRFEESHELLSDSQFMDALEYGRIIHAEMSAITDAARLGRELSGAILYSTTFPCHMCAKHIVSSGISKVFFLEPYPKSLASRLHGDSISIEGGDRGRYNEFDKVEFTHFYGISPRRYRELFERGKRKQDGRFQEWINGRRRPIIDIKFPFYQTFESEMLQALADYMLKIVRSGSSPG